LPSLPFKVMSFPGTLDTEGSGGRCFPLHPSRRSRNPLRRFLLLQRSVLLLFILHQTSSSSFYLDIFTTPRAPSKLLSPPYLPPTPTLPPPGKFLTHKFQPQSPAHLSSFSVWFSFFFFFFSFLFEQLNLCPFSSIFPCPERDLVKVCRRAALPRVRVYCPYPLQSSAPVTQKKIKTENALSTVVHISFLRVFL